jgi:hypothetical protein
MTAAGIVLSMNAIPGNFLHQTEFNARNWHWQFTTNVGKKNFHKRNSIAGM